MTEGSAAMIGARRRDSARVSRCVGALVTVVCTWCGLLAGGAAANSLPVLAYPQVASDPTGDVLQCGGPIRATARPSCGRRGGLRAAHGRIRLTCRARVASSTSSRGWRSARPERRSLSGITTTAPITLCRRRAGLRAAAGRPRSTSRPPGMTPRNGGSDQRGGSRSRRVAGLQRPRAESDGADGVAARGRRLAALAAALGSQPRRRRPQVALNATGEAVAVWESSVTGGQYPDFVQAAGRPAGGNWSAPVNVSAPSQGAACSRRWRWTGRAPPLPHGSAC